jgi:Zn-dependent protease
MDFFSLDLLIFLIVFAVSVAFHESAHALSAYLLGDPTAKMEGRISLNPLKHIDPLGLLFLIFAHFGWAKPVPIDARNFERPRLYTALSAGAGPVSNLILSFLALQIGLFIPENSPLLLVTFLDALYLVNILLAAFNLLPLFPLDGEKVLMLLIPRSFLPEYFAFREYGPLILFGIIGVEAIFRIEIIWLVLGPIVNFFDTGMKLLSIV